MGRVALTLAFGAIVGCGPYSNISFSEAQETLDAVILSGEGEGLFTELIEVSTSFPLGIAIEDASAELAAFMETQSSCATVTLEGTTVTVDFGALESNCTLNDYPYGGVVTLDITNTADNAAQVLHRWTGLSSGGVTLDGEAEVTWAGIGEGHTRHVVHSATWTRADGTTVEASGERLQALQVPSEGLSAGVVVSGSRDWNHGGEPWHVSINNVEVMGLDPVPEDGSYTVLTPHNKEFDVAFTRNDDDTITVTISGNIQSYPFDVTRSGEIIED